MGKSIVAELEQLKRDYAAAVELATMLNREIHLLTQRLKEKDKIINELMQQKENKP